MALPKSADAVGPLELGDEEARPGIGLCLSGGGYRAMLFHLGALWRLNEAAYLKQIARISSVSGGSIVAAALGKSWSSLEFGDDGIVSAESFQRELVGPVRELAGKTIDVPAALTGLLLPGKTIGDRIVRAYKNYLFGKATLQDLPDAKGPRFVINATNLQSGALWRFSRPYARDYKVGEIANPTIPLAVAVAASSAFPPFLAPMRLRFDEADYTPNSGTCLQEAPYTTRPVLGDGGIYDNLGLQTISSFETILISDGGGAMAADPGGLGPAEWWRWRDWGTQTYRVLRVIDNQVRSLRKREAIKAYRTEPSSRQHRDGTYWGIRSHIADYELDDALDFPRGLGEQLADVSTRLKGLQPKLQEQLIDWGYAICDTAMRKWVEPALPKPAGLPYPL